MVGISYDSVINGTLAQEAGTPHSQVAAAIYQSLAVADTMKVVKSGII